MEEAELNLHEKSEAISKLARLSMEALEPSQFLSEITFGILSGIRVTGGILGILTKEASLELVGTFGYSENDVKEFRTIPMKEDLPITLCIKDKRMVVHSSKEEFKMHYPKYGDFESLTNIDVTTFAMPLIYRLSAIGAIGFTAEDCSEDLFKDTNFWEGFGSICTFYTLQRIQSKSLYGQSITTADLSPRQIEILKRFKDGSTIEKIADELNFSNSTIRQEIMRIYKKLGVRDRLSAFEIAKEKKII